MTMLFLFLKTNFFLLFQDGSHIKGLLINFFHFHWPELLKQPFLEQFITPIIKATQESLVP